MPAMSIPNHGKKWVSATGEFLTKKNAAEPLLRLIIAGLRASFGRNGCILASSPPGLLESLGWQEFAQNQDFKEGKAKMFESKGVGPLQTHDTALLHPSIRSG